jgi:hypothetical protein
VRRKVGILSLGLLAFAVSAYGQNQSTTAPHEATTQSTVQKQGRSAGGDIGSGSGDIGKGAGKGAGNLAKGTGKGAADLATRSSRRCRWSGWKRWSIGRQERRCWDSKRDGKNRQGYR